MPLTTSPTRSLYSAKMFSRSASRTFWKITCLAVCAAMRPSTSVGFGNSISMSDFGFVAVELLRLRRARSRWPGSVTSVDDLLDREEIDLAGLRVEARLQVLVRSCSTCARPSGRRPRWRVMTTSGSMPFSLASASIVCCSGLHVCSSLVSRTPLRAAPRVITARAASRCTLSVPRASSTTSSPSTPAQPAREVPSGRRPARAPRSSRAGRRSAGSRRRRAAAGRGRATTPPGCSAVGSGVLDVENRARSRG